MLPRRIADALAVGDRGHGRYAGLVQAPDGLPLLARAEHRELGGEQVLGDLAPADATVDLDEVAAPVDLGAQGAAPLQFAVDLALQRLHRLERVAPAPQALERLFQHQPHEASPRIRSAARCGML